MTTPLNRKLARLVAAVLAPAALFASPNISVDSADANIGTILEGQSGTIKHVFKVKNTGDSVLKIQSVKPG
jgi:hypothetical protein